MVSILAKVTKLGEFDITKYNTIIFDLDSTLTNANKFPLRACEWLFENHPGLQYVEIKDFLHHLYSNYYEGIQSIVQGAPYKAPFLIVYEAMRSSLIELDVEPNEKIVRESVRVMMKYHRDLSELDIGVAELLQYLSSLGIRLGVFSNSFTGHAKIILSRLGIDHYFDVIADTESPKAFKPMPEVFRFMLERLNASPTTTLSIGDEYFADVVGAYNSGLDAIWVNYKRQPIGGYLSKYGLETKPVLTVHKLNDLTKLLTIE